MSLSVLAFVLFLYFVWGTFFIRYWRLENAHEA